MIAARTFERRQIQTAGWLADPANITYVAEIDAGDVAGFALGSPPREGEPNAMLRALYIEQRAHRLGIGRALTTAVLAELRSRSFDPIDVSVFAPNAGARAFYESLGARLVMEQTTSVDDTLIPIACYTWALDR